MSDPASSHARSAPIRKGFVRLPHGQVHYRAAGSGPPIVLLHDSPRSSSMHRPLLAAWSDEFTVIALDTPGYGNSTPLPDTPQPEIADFAAALAATLAALGIERCPVYGFHTSSKINLQFAIDHPGRVSLAIIDGLNLPPGGPPPEFISRYMKPFVVTDDGSYLAATWAKARELFRFFPWFDKSPQSRLPLPLPDDEFLHGYVLDMLMAGAHYSSAYSAAMRYLALPKVPQVRAPVLFTCRDNDPLYPFLDALPRELPPGCRIERMGSDTTQWRERIREQLRSAASGGPVSLPSDFAAAHAGESRGYVELPHGQMHWRRWGGPSLQRPLLLLPELPGSSAGCAALALTLSARRQVYAADMPGIGESDPLPSPGFAAQVDALARALDALALGEVDVHAEFTAAPFALELARRQPQRIRHLVLDGLPLLTASDRRQMAQRYCPPLAVENNGGHLLALWQRLRDQELTWPWYERSATAIRRRAAG